MPPNTNLLIKISFYFLLSASLLAGPMFFEPTDKDTSEQKAAELEASQRAQTDPIYEEAPSSAQSEERNGSATASLAEEPIEDSKFGGQLIHQTARSGEMNIERKTPLPALAANIVGAEARSGSAAGSEVEAPKRSIGNNTSARFDTHVMAPTVNSPLHESLLAAQENASRLLSPLTTSAEMEYVEQVENPLALETAVPSSALAAPGPQVTAPTTRKEKIEESIRIATAQIALMNGKANEAAQNEKPEFAARYRGVAAKLEESVSLRMQALQADAQGKTAQIVHLYHAGISTQSSADVQLKAIEAEESGKSELAVRYRGVAAKLKEAVALHMQALQADAQGKADQAECLGYAVFSASSNAEAQLKAIEADESGKLELAARYRGVASKSEEAVTSYMQALQAKVQGKTDEGIFLSNQGASTQFSVKAELKAIEADESGKLELAARYRGIAAKWDEAVALYTQAFQAEVQGKADQVKYLGRAGLYTKSSADVQLEAIEAEESGKSELAVRYRGVAAKLEEAVGLYMQAAQADAQGKVGQRMNLGNAGYYTSLNATAQLKVIEAEESGKPELAARYREVAAKWDEAVVLYMQTAQADAQGKANQVILLNNVACSTQMSGKAQLNVIEAEEGGKPELAQRYRGVAAKSEEAVGLCMQALQAEVERKISKAHALDSAGFFIHGSLKAELKAAEASENGKLDLARSYEAIGKIYQEAATLAHSASLLENKTESIKLKKTATARAQIAKNQLDELERS